MSEGRRKGILSPQTPSASGERSLRRKNAWQTDRADSAAKLVSRNLVKFVSPDKPMSRRLVGVVRGCGLILWVVLLAGLVVWVAAAPLAWILRDGLNSSTQPGKVSHAAFGIT
jgi:hypothetical protein